MVDFLRRVLFESLPLLLVAELLAVAITVSLHRRFGTRRSRWAVWITLVVSVGLIVLQPLVVTDREAVETAVKSMASAVDDGDVEAMGAHLDDSFRWVDEDREGFLASARRTLQAVDVSAARTFGHKVEINGDTAKVSFNAVCDVRRGGEMYANFMTRWELRFVRRGDKWRLERVESARWGPPVGAAGGDLRSEIR